MGDKIHLTNEKPAINKTLIITTTDVRFDFSRFFLNFTLKYVCNVIFRVLDPASLVARRDKTKASVSIWLTT